MFNHVMYENKIVQYQQNTLESCAKKNWLAFFKSMKDKRKIEILLQVIERIYSKGLAMQTLDRRINDRYI